MDVAIGGVEIRREERHEIPMTLQLLRGRDLRPPSRRTQLRPAAVTGTPEQNGVTLETQPRKKILRFPVNPEARAFYRLEQLWGEVPARAVGADA